MGYKETLDSLSEKISDEVTIGDNSAHSVEGIGNCTLKLKLGNTFLLEMRLLTFIGVCIKNMKFFIFYF